MASSKDMLIENMAPKSRLKGLELLGTGDAFHPRWLDIIEESTTYSGDGITVDCTQGRIKLIFDRVIRTSYSAEGLI